MPKANSKNIRIFPDWFGIDNKSARCHFELCEFLYNKIPGNTLEWSSDKTCFWLEEKNAYYQYVCDDGRFFNFPEDINGIELPGVKIVKVIRKYVGKIHGSEAQRTYSGEIDPYYFEQARQDLAENPIPQASFDWDIVKQAVEAE